MNNPLLAIQVGSVGVFICVRQLMGRASIGLLEITCRPYVRHLLSPLPHVSVLLQTNHRMRDAGWEVSG